jgi:hypothetical protein
MEKQPRKTTLLNSGNYWTSLKVRNPSDSQTDLTRNSILTNIHWGIQRAIGTIGLLISGIG